MRAAGSTGNTYSTTTLGEVLSSFPQDFTNTCAVANMERVKQLAAHLTGSSQGLSGLERRSPSDVVITMAIRSPLCKAKKGGFKDARFVVVNIFEE